METLIGIVIAVVIAIGAYLFGRGSNGRGMGRTRDDLDRAGDANRGASSRIGVSRDSVDRSITKNNRGRELLKRGRALLDRVRKRAKKKDDSLGGG